MAETILFQKLHDRHITDILAIERKSNTAAWSENSFRHELSHPDSIFLVAESGTRAVAFGGGWLLADEFHIINIAVDPDSRRTGLGRRMMVELVERAKEEGATCATLEVRESNTPAISLYEKLGFVKVGARKNYYPDNKETALVMWLHDLAGWEPAS